MKNSSSQSTIDRVVILAGGLGTRLHPYTITIPKVLVPIGELPILEIIVRQLANCGFTHLTLAINHQAELIKSFFGDGSKWGVLIDYSLEQKQLSTMGPLTLIPDLPENFLVMNGDILTDIDYAKFAHNHLAQNKIFTISSYIRNEIVDYGVLEVNEENELTEFREKPSMSYHVSMGLYTISKTALDLIPEDTYYGFDDLMHDLLKQRKPVSVYTHDGEWLDIGRPDDYAAAVEKFESMKSVFLP